MRQGEQPPVNRGENVGGTPRQGKVNQSPVKLTPEQEREMRGRQLRAITYMQDRRRQKPDPQRDNIRLNLVYYSCLRVGIRNAEVTAAEVSMVAANKAEPKDIDKIKSVMVVLAEEGIIADKYKDHPLTGNFADYRECHIEPDWLLIYKLKPLEICFVRTGTHADLFG